MSRKGKNTGFGKRQFQIYHGRKGRSYYEIAKLLLLIIEILEEK